MIAIPRSEIEKAISHAREDLHHERVGFFFTWAGAEPMAKYYPAENIAINSRVSSEVAAEWMAKQIIVMDLKPVAMFHSHPSGSPYPSTGDRQFFPSHYVDEALIWNELAPTVMTQYDNNGHTRFVHLDGVIIGAAWGD